MIIRVLTRKELEVMTHLANGKTLEEICEDMNIHKATVLDHVRVAIRKLGATNRTHAVAIAVQAGIVKLE